MGETSRTRELCKILFTRRHVDSYPLIAGMQKDEAGRVRGAPPPGWPDRLLSHKSCGLCLVEFKDWDTKVTPLQKRRLGELQRACICRFKQDYADMDGRRLVRLEGLEVHTEWFDAVKLPEMLQVFFLQV